MPKTSPAQRFAKIFNLFMDPNASQGDRDNAGRKMNEWLKRHGKTHADIQAILVQAAADDAAAQPPPPPSDPRASAPHPFDDPKFTPADLVEGIVSKYLWMREHVRVIYVLWAVFTHVFTKFAIAPRVALISDRPDSGKTTALDVARPLVFRPNPEALGTGAAIREFLDQGPGTVMLDELDQLDAEARRALLRIWNLGHKRGAKISLMVGGKRKVFNLHAPMIAAGVGDFLGATQMSRAFKFGMEPYDEKTKPEKEFDEEDEDVMSGLNKVYAYLRHWAATVKLDPRPSMPSGIERRFADNVRGLLSIADSCGPEWGRRAREAVAYLLEKEKARRPEITILRHGLVIFDDQKIGQIKSTQFNRELKQLDLPDANWNRYRGASGTDYLHPLAIAEQAALLAEVGIKSGKIRPPGEKQCRGYKRAQFEEAWREYGSAVSDDGVSAREHLRLIKPPSD